jgi:hypothetical protein
MSRRKDKLSDAELDALVGEASWLVSHARALTDYGRGEEATAEWARAANCEEQVACALDAAGQPVEAAIHRASAAACCQHSGQPVRAVTLLRAALQADLPGDYRSQVERQLADCLPLALADLRKAASARGRNRPPAPSLKPGVADLRSGQPLQ